MDSIEYIEMTGCERLLERVNTKSANTPWGDNIESQNLEIVKEFLTHRYQELKGKQ